jgi:hypothetical protein
MYINLALKTKIEFLGNYEQPFSGNEAFPPYPTYSRTHVLTYSCTHVLTRVVITDVFG